MPGWKPASPRIPRRIICQHGLAAGGGPAEQILEASELQIPDFLMRAESPLVELSMDGLIPDDPSCARVRKAGPSTTTPPSSWPGRMMSPTPGSGPAVSPEVGTHPWSGDKQDAQRRREAR